MLKPLPSSKWNYTTAAHLLNRAGFGGTPAEINELVKMGMVKAVAHFVDYEKIHDPAEPPLWAKKDNGIAARLQEIRNIQVEMRKAKTDDERKALDEKRRNLTRDEQREQKFNMVDLRGWWLRRMATTPRPLQEKLTLFWHGHFATSIDKVKYTYFMYLQNETLRQHAMGNWPELLEAMAKDPAMLIWLDQTQSRKQHPNENFARELMELFALGEGHYTEKDITEAARALTGYTLNREKQEFEYRAFIHDDGVKTVLGKVGNLSGSDVLQLVATQPQSAKFISAKLWRFFASENPSPELIAALADIFTRNGNNFKPLLRAIFRSEEFYAVSIIRNQIKSPVQWLVGTSRMLEREMPEPIITTVMLNQLGQELFAPPNVKGWDGGLSWITTNNLLVRYNEAAVLVLAQSPGTMETKGGASKKIEERTKQLVKRWPVVDVKKILSEKERTTKADVIPALEKRFLQAELKGKQKQVLRDFLDSRGELDDTDIRQTIRLLMSTPEYQLT